MRCFATCYRNKQCAAIIEQTDLTLRPSQLQAYNSSSSSNGFSYSSCVIIISGDFNVS